MFLFFQIFRLEILFATYLIATTTADFLINTRFYSEGSPNLNSSSNKKKDAKKLNSGASGGVDASADLDPRHVFLFEQSMLVAEAEKGSGSSNFIGPRYFFKNFIKVNYQLLEKVYIDCHLQVFVRKIRWCRLFLQHY